jgi:hypothetical protein
MLDFFAMKACARSFRNHPEMLRKVGSSRHATSIRFMPQCVALFLTNGGMEKIQFGDRGAIDLRELLGAPDLLFQSLNSGNRFLHLDRSCKRPARVKLLPVQF